MDMPGIFEDERRSDGVSSSRPAGICTQSALAALRTLESALHVQRAHALRERIGLQTVIHAEFVHAA